MRVREFIPCTTFGFETVLGRRLVLPRPSCWSCKCITLLEWSVGKWCLRVGSNAWKGITIHLLLRSKRAPDQQASVHCNSTWPAAKSGLAHPFPFIIATTLRCGSTKPIVFPDKESHLNQSRLPTLETWIFRMSSRGPEIYLLWRCTWCALLFKIYLDFWPTGIGIRSTEFIKGHIIILVAVM